MGLAYAVTGDNLLHVLVKSAGGISAGLQFLLPNFYLGVLGLEVSH